VLIDEGSPLQVTLAVLVSGWAHVLHAMYKPWGAGSVLYGLQHGSLFVTSFVFLMGLLFKVQGVTTGTPAYRFLSAVMLLLCVVFLSTWAAVVVHRIAVAVRSRRAAPTTASVVAASDAASCTSEAPMHVNPMRGVAASRTGGASSSHGAPHVSVARAAPARRDSRRAQVVAALSPLAAPMQIRGPAQEDA
jgi:hypothetical protein